MMKKKQLRIFSIIAGIIFLLFLVINFGLNLWLKNNLADYIKNNTSYRVTYKSLDVDLGTGNINSTGLTINSKDPQNENILELQGTIDTLSVSRLGIYDALFKKRITTSDLRLSNPHLNIILPKPAKNKVEKKQNPLVVKNIAITNGDIQIFKHSKQKFLSVHHLDLQVKNLKMTEETKTEKIPFAFDQYEISAKNLYFRPDNVYAFTAKEIATKVGQLSVKNLALIPLLSYRNFTKYYPKKRNLFDFKTEAMDFKDFVLKDDKITLTKVRFENPELKMFTTNVSPQKKDRSFTYDVQLEDVFFNNAKIDIVKPNGNPLFSAGNLTMKIEQFVMNEETARGNIPFQYNNFKIDGRNLNYVSNTQNIKVAAIALNPKMADLRTISMKPTASASDKTLLDLDAQNVTMKVNEWKFVDNKLKLNIQNVLVDGLKGKIVGAENPKKIKPNYNGIAFPLIIKNVSLKNADLVYDKAGKPLAFTELNADIRDVEMNENTVKNGIPFKTGFYSLTTRNFNYKTEFYNLSASLLKFNKNTMHVSNFVMKPTVSRAQFIRSIPTEKDLYDIKVAKIDMKGRWDFFSATKSLNASQVTLDRVDANIFRSKIPKDDLTEKPMYSKLLRSIKFPMFINNLDIKNSLLVYEEDTKKSDGPGKLTFSNFNLNVKNLNSGKMKGKPTEVPITIKCLFMNASPMNVKWSFNTASSSDVFAISGNVADLPASRINPFIVPYLKIQATGLISDLIFDFKGNYNGLGGSLIMKHENLKVSVLKETGEENKLLSAVANIFVRTDSGNYPDSVDVEEVERDKTKSFFNLLWRGIEQGLKKTLIGKSAPKTEETIRKTVDNTKTALEENRKDLKETKVEVKQKVEAVKEKVQETKQKGIFRKIFKKKSEN